jgi:hypothetical protein
MFEPALLVHLFFTKQKKRAETCAEQLKKSAMRGFQEDQP